MSSDAHLQAVRERLLQERDALDASEATSREAARPRELDPQREGRLSRMSMIEQQAMSQATLRRREIRRARIEGALARLDAGEYGSCPRCGEDIEAKRLALDPAVPLCGACARSLDTRSP
jgi:DnaK suppressor protein